MQRELVWAADSTVIEGVGRAFSEILEEARTQGKNAVEAPASAVHEYRRAIRRAEAVAMLAAPFLRKPQRRWLMEAIGRARRRTRVLRDLDAVMPLVSELPEILPEVDVSIFEGLNQWLGQCRTEVASEELAAWRLRKNVRALAGLGDIFGVGMHTWADLDMLVDSVRGTYREARRAWKTACESLCEDDVHALRRAARTLRYQLELLASREDLPAASEFDAAHRAVKGLVKAIGEVTDLMALRDIAAEAHIDAGFDPEAMKDALEGAIASRIEDVLGRAGEVFSRRAKAFLVPEQVVCIATGPETAEVEVAGESAPVALVAGESAPEALGAEPVAPLTSEA
jgi:CHAD domain-containing protein